MTSLCKVREAIVGRSCRYRHACSQQSRNAGGMWKTLLIHIRQSNTGENYAFVTAAFQCILLGHASISQPHPQKSSKVLPHCSGVSKHKRVENVLCLVKSWCLPVSGAVNEGSVMGPFCLDEKHHWDLDETPGEVQERASWYHKGNVFSVLNRLIRYR